MERCNHQYRPSLRGGYMCELCEKDIDSGTYDEIAQLTAERDRYKLAVEEVATHLGAVKSIIEYAIETKPERCLLTEKYNGLCPHCESDISWLQHELKAHGEYTAIIESALGKEAK